MDFCGVRRLSELNGDNLCVVFCVGLEVCGDLVIDNAFLNERVRVL